MDRSNHKKGPELSILIKKNHRTNVERIISISLQKDINLIIYLTLM